MHHGHGPQARRREHRQVHTSRSRAAQRATTLHVLAMGSRSSLPHLTNLSARAALLLAVGMGRGLPAVAGLAAQADLLRQHAPWLATRVGELRERQRAVRRPATCVKNGAPVQGGRGPRIATSSHAMMDPVLLAQRGSPGERTVCRSTGLWSVCQARAVHCAEVCMP